MSVAVIVLVLLGAAIGALSSQAMGRAAPSPVPVVVEVPAVEPIDVPPEEPSAATSAAAQADPGWLARTSARTAIPQRALQAYASAALTLAESQPGCGLGWNTLAGIGWVESGHGSHRGAALGEDGRPDPPIIGPALAGGAYAAIRDSDQGEWDGDPEWDRAVGPMQFIPSTWRRWGSDADGDGVADPQQIDDAALSAARYLCAAGSVVSATAWRAAVLSYNNSGSYADAVAAAAAGYAAAAG